MPVTHKALGWAEQFQDRLQPGKVSADHSKELWEKRVMRLRGLKAEVPDSVGGSTNEEVTVSFSRAVKLSSCSLAISNGEKGRRSSHGGKKVEQVLKIKDSQRWEWEWRSKQEGAFAIGWARVSQHQRTQRSTH